MLLALLLALAIGAAAGTATMLDPRLRAADDLWVAAIVGASGALAGWAVVTSVLAFGGDGFDAADAAGALLGAVILLGLARRGRRTQLSGEAGDDASRPAG